MLPRWGWQSVIYVGGILPLVVALILIKVLPESVRYLGMSGAGQKKIRAILTRISPELRDVPVRASLKEDRPSEGFPVKHLFTEGRTLGTLLLWVPNFMNLLIIYFIVSWLPALLQQTRMPVSAGISAILLFSVGGMAGSLIEGRLMNGFGAKGILVFEFVISTLLIGSLAFSTSFALIMTITFILGFTIQGAQGGLNALAARFYPTAIRSTGVGWALGVGRIGSIVGPVLGGIMLSIGWHPRQIFLAGTIPSLCAAVAILLTGSLRGNSNACTGESYNESELNTGDTSEA
jgi:AAHS family 4-hydroxybenzoate transporter-like MFS transporter